MQLTRTNAVFSRIALVSSFCVEKSTFEKNSDFNCNRHISPEDPRSQRGVGEAARGDHAIVGRGQGWARALVWRGCLGRPPTLPFVLHKALDLNIIGGIGHISRNTSTLHRQRDLDSGDQKFRSGTLPGREFGGDHHHRHHHRLSIEHP